MISSSGIARTTLQKPTSAFVEANVISSNGADYNSFRNTRYQHNDMASCAKLYPEEERLFDFDDLSSDDEDVTTLGTDYECAIQELHNTLRLSDAACQVKCLVENIKSISRSRRLEPMQLAQALCAVLGDHRAFVRSAVGTSNSKNCLTTLKHTYVVVAPTQSVGLELVVEPYFNEAFELGRTTARYANFHRHIPDVFVGTRVTLARLVKLAAREIEVACHTLEQPIPPWRKYSSLMSKWALDRREDMSLSTVDSMPLSFASESSDGCAAAPTAPAKVIYGFNVPVESEWLSIKAHIPQNIMQNAMAPIAEVSPATELDALFGKIQKVKLRYGAEY